MHLIRLFSSLLPTTCHLFLAAVKFYTLSYQLSTCPHHFRTELLFNIFLENQTRALLWLIVEEKPVGEKCSRLIWIKREMLWNMTSQNLVAKAKLAWTQTDRLLKQQHLHQLETQFFLRLLPKQLKVAKHRAVLSCLVQCLAIHHQKGGTHLKGFSLINIYVSYY